MIRQHDNRDRAVSPVIGVILMVATTVIVAAVIGIFMLGIAEGVGATPQAGVTVDEDEGKTLTIQIKDTGNLDRLEVIMPTGQDDLKEIEGNSCNFCSSGWPTDDTDPDPPGGPLIVGDWETEDDDTGSSVGKFVNDDPEVADSVRFSAPAREVFVFGSGSDNDNLKEGDVITIVGFSDGERAVLREHVVSEEIDLDDS